MKALEYTSETQLTIYNRHYYYHYTLHNCMQMNWKMNTWDIL